MYVLVMLVSIVVNYNMAMAISAYNGQRKSRIFLTLAICFNLSILMAFKYTNFITENISALTGIPINIPRIHLPIGISFFTFQGMSYIMDVYRDSTFARRKLSHVALYISFFPQLIAGPVVRFHDIADQIESRTETVEKMASGLRRFSLGLGKKLLIANAAGKIADMVFALDMPSCTTSEAWIGALAYSLQIYFDFSGYSDMAIGLGRLFGFEIMENFKHPYIARSIRDFWRRWHISLSSWFRDYLYIPLGGNRRGARRTYFNLSVVFFLTGLWHGAEWTFVLWGLFHGVFMILERTGAIRPERFRPKPLANLYTLIVAVTGFVIFRSESLSQAGWMLTAMFARFSFGFRDAGLYAVLLSPANLAILAAACLAAMPVVHRIRDRASGSAALTAATNAAGYVFSFALLVLCLLALSLDTYNPFIYFRF